MGPRDLISRTEGSHHNLTHPGIYLIYCCASGKGYVGQQNQRNGGFRARWSQHKYRLRHNRCGNPHLQNAWNKYGADSFHFAVLENCASERLDEREAYYIRQLDPETCMNLAPVSTHMVTTEEYRKAQSERMKRFYQEHPEKAPNSAKVSERMQAFWASPEGQIRKQQLSEQQKGQPGRPHNEETKAKLRQARIGKSLSEETKSKIAASMRGKPHLSEAAKARLSALKKGVPRPRHVIEAMIRGRRARKAPPC